MCKEGSCHFYSLQRVVTWYVILGQLRPRQAFVHCCAKLHAGSSPLVHGHSLTAFGLLSGSKTLSGSHPVNTATSLSASLGGRSQPSPFTSGLSSGFWPGVVLKDWMVGDGRVCSPMSALGCQDLSQLTIKAKMAVVHRCKFHIMVMHIFVEILNIFTWTRKCVIWWRTLLAQIWPQLLPNHKPVVTYKYLHWQCARIYVLDFVLFSRKNNISIYSLSGWSRCSVDWSPHGFIFNRIAQRGAKLELISLPPPPPLFVHLDTDVCRCLKVFKRGAALSKKRRKVASVWLFRQMFATPARDGFGSLKTLFVRGAHPSVVICVSVHLNKVIPPSSHPSFFCS